MKEKSYNNDLIDIAKKITTVRTKLGGDHFFKHVYENIESLACCGNCSNYDYKEPEYFCPTHIEFPCPENYCENWEFDDKTKEDRLI